MTRYFVKFPSIKMMPALFGARGNPSGDANFKMLFSQPNVALAVLNDKQRLFFESEGAQIFADVQLHVLPDQSGWDEQAATHRQGQAGDPVDTSSLRDIVEIVKAPKVWNRTRGENTTIVIVDQGVSANLREIPISRRSNLDVQTFYTGNHWEDLSGHGSMCAAIAAGSTDAGGRYEGIAPNATVVSARTNLFTSDIADVFDELMRARSDGRLKGPTIVSNSYGFRCCAPPEKIPFDHPFMVAVDNAVKTGFFVCFAAGNNHHTVCGNDPRSCGPNSIWGPNSLDQVMSVGTVNQALSNCDPATPHVDSSRGKGQWATTTTKPDCVAPTYGEVPWGATYRRMNWWGTSGACPQVAGLASLILSVAPNLRPEDVAAIIRDTCVTLPEGSTCVGRGLIDCEAAVAMAATIRPVV